MTTHIELAGLESFSISRAGTGYHLEFVGEKGYTSIIIWPAMGSGTHPILESIHQLLNFPAADTIPAQWDGIGPEEGAI